MSITEMAWRIPMVTYARRPSEVIAMLRADQMKSAPQRSMLFRYGTAIATAAVAILVKLLDSVIEQRTPYHRNQQRHLWVFTSSSFHAELQQHTCHSETMATNTDLMCSVSHRLDTPHVWRLYAAELPGGPAVTGCGIGDPRSDENGR